MAQTRLPFILIWNFMAQNRTRPECRSGTGTGGISAGSRSVDLAGIRPVPRFFSERALKVAKTTVENICSLKSENVEMLLFLQRFK